MGGLAILGQWVAHILRATKKHCKNALKTELDQNLLASQEIENKLKTFRETDPSTKIYVLLSDFSWNNYKNVRGSYDKKITDTLCKAYMYVGMINTIINASFHHGIADAYKSFRKF